jgi:nucleoid-associated protein YgaU
LQVSLLPVLRGGLLDMPNDAKLGLVLGVGIVIAVAAVFFRKEAAASLPAPARGTAAAVSSAKEEADNSRTSGRPVNAKRSAQSGAKLSQAIPAGRRHTVKEGDTLTGIAEQYYGDSQQSDVILQANRDVLQSADDLTPGTRLVIPSAAKRSALPAGTNTDS